MTTKKLSWRQARWIEFLSGFHFVIFYILNRKNRKTNSFTYGPNDGLADDQDD